jgi:hypothetical protein
LDDNGWNFRTAQYHEQNRRTLFKAHGLKFLLNVKGRGGKFDLTKTIIIIVTGIGLMGLANILCDILLLNFSSKFRKEVVEKKYESITPRLKQEVLKHIIACPGIADDIKNSLFTISTIVAAGAPLTTVGQAVKQDSRIDEEELHWV